MEAWNEAGMIPPLLTDSVQSILARLTPDTPRILIALAGLPGSGKSTLAAYLAAEVNAIAGPGTMAALGMDGFHLSKAVLRRMPDPDAAFARRGAPWTFDVPALVTRLHELREASGRSAVGWPGFQHEIGDPVEDALAVAPMTRLILVEGLYLLHSEDGWEELGPLWDERWYLDTPMETAMERLTERHRTAWGLTRAEAERRVAANDCLNAEIVARTRSRADKRVGG